MYTANEAFEKLRALGITKNIKSVRRWLRDGDIKGIKPRTRREGWTITDEALEEFIAKKVPAANRIENVPNETYEEVQKLRLEVGRLKEENIHLDNQVSNVTNESLEEMENLRSEVEQLKKENARLTEQASSYGISKTLNEIEQLAISIWQIVSENWDGELPDDVVLENAKSSLLAGLKNIEIQQNPQYISPWEGIAGSRQKRFGSIDRLIKSAIPKIIAMSANSKKRAQELKELKEIEEDRKKQRTFMDMW